MDVIHNKNSNFLFKVAEELVPAINPEDSLILKII